MNLICVNEKCRRSFNNIDVFSGWDERKIRAALAMFNGDKEKLRVHQEEATELDASCPDCGSKMTRDGVDPVIKKMAKSLRNQAIKEDLQRELADLDQFGEENWDDLQRKRAKEIEDWLAEIEEDERKSRS